MTEKRNIIIFGASAGLHQIRPTLKEMGEILFVVDNDPAKWGQKAEGYKIFPPEILKEKKPHEIVIVCSWWEKSISRQLRSYGLTCNKDFWLDINFSLSAERYFQIFQEFIAFLGRNSLSPVGKKIVHIGVGHTLLVDILLAMAGAQVVCSNLEDELIFFPDVSPSLEIYHKLFKFYKYNKEMFISPPGGVLEISSSSASVDPCKVSFLVMDAENLPLNTHSADYIFTHDLLEHVVNPGVAIEECFRVIKPGGIFYHHVHPGEHRTGVPFLDLYTYTETEWLKICRKNGYHHNRWLSCQFIDHIRKSAGNLFETTSRIAGDHPSDACPPPMIAKQFSRFSHEEIKYSTGFLTIGGIS